MAARLPAYAGSHEPHCHHAAQASPCEAGRAIACGPQAPPRAVAQLAAAGGSPCRNALCCARRQRPGALGSGRPTAALPLFLAGTNACSRVVRTRAARHAGRVGDVDPVSCIWPHRHAGGTLAGRGGRIAAGAAHACRRSRGCFRSHARVGRPPARLGVTS